MFGKIKQTGQALSAQRKISALNKKLGEIKVEITEGNVTIVAKGAIATYEIESIKVDGEEVPAFKKAKKKALKEIQKKLVKMSKSGALEGLDLM
ncbi:MAG TPA: hypothetical protein ENJ78_00615 [candidate division WWE3 bacterium]|uniref:YbaB/EbfC family DNA-binding protein n=1 Tax=candidate division WWE3 bacterium TaxID=2053526 RepID=A0A7V5MHK6_UNCKA|nr:hypothetical protein [candidate division WWE3 bacterium]